jgi:hypothetical protein
VGERNLGPLSGARPVFPDGLIDEDDRGCDIFGPLFAIADLAGGAWPAAARDAAIANRAIRFGSNEDAHIELLRDIRTLISGRTGDTVFSVPLVGHLNADPGLRWAEWKRNQGLSAKGLSLLLGDFGIRSIVRQVHGKQAHGYRRSDLEDAFLRYLGPLESGQDAETVEEVTSIIEERSPADIFRRKSEEERRLMG